MTLRTARGLFVSIEGTDGVGKTTQINLLNEVAAQKGWLLTRNPGGSSLGLRLRELLLEDKNLKVCQKAELLLYMADRAQHIEEVILPAISEGLVVICDRFIDSTVAYQGYGRGIDLNFIHGLNDEVTEGLKPDLTILLDIDPQTALQRAQSKDKMEGEGLLFQQKVRQGFLSLAKAEPERFLLIDVTNKTPQQLHQMILTAITDKLNGK